MVRVRVENGGMLSEYVPFYFGPRSPMLYVIHHNGVPTYQGGQDSIVHLVSNVDKVLQNKLEYAFTDGHPTKIFTEFYDNWTHANKVDWSLMTSQYWHAADWDRDRPRRRQAEFLVRDFFPWELVTDIGVIDDGMAVKIGALLKSIAHRPVVIIKRNWYY